MKEIDQLKTQYQVPYLEEKYGFPVYLGIGFDPHIFIWKDFSCWEVKTHLFKYMVENNLGNTLRTCLYTGWGGAAEHVHKPWLKDNNRIFQLPDPEKLELSLSEADRMAEIEKYINPVWRRRILRNSENAFKRAITIMLDFNVQWKREAWGNFWLNPERCNRDVWNTTAGQWHYYEYWDMPGGERIRRTGLIVENFERYMRNELLKVARKYDAEKFLVFSAGNENCAGMGWHQRKSDIFETRLTRKLTSIQFKDFMYKKPIHTLFQYGVHGIGRVEVYEAWKEEFADNGYTGRWLPCCDGYYMKDDKIAMPTGREIARIIKASLRDGNLGYELLHGMWGFQGMDLARWDWNSVYWLMRGFKRWRKEHNE